MPSSPAVDPATASLPSGYVIDPGATLVSGSQPGFLDRLAAASASQPSSVMPQGLLQRLAAKADAINGETGASPSSSNPFDQFDPPHRTPNVFDQFDKSGGAGTGSPTLPPGSPPPGAIADPYAQWDSKTPSTTAAADPYAKFVSSGGGGAVVPRGYTLDPLPPPQTPGFLDRLGGELGRGILGGSIGVIDTAQAGGRLADRATAAVTGALPWWLGGGPHGAISTALGPVNDLDSKVDNADLNTPVAAEENRQGYYQPTSGPGRIVEDVASGITGAALGGAGSKLGLASGAASGGATGAVQAVGGNSTDAGIAGLVAGVAVPGALAARGLAGAAAAQSVVSRTAPTVATDPEAAASVLRTSQAIQDVTAASPKASPADAAATVSANLQRGLTAHIGILKRTGLIDSDDAVSLRSAISDAADPSHSGAGLQGVVDGMSLPLPLAKPLSDGLADLQTLSSGVLTSPAAGPLRSLGRLAGTYSAPVVAAVGGHSVGLGPLLDVAAGAAGVAVHKPVATAGGILGSVGDLLAGTRVSPGQAVTAAAQRTLDGAFPGALPTDQLAAVQAAYRDAQASAAGDTQAASAAALKAKQTDAAWKANAASQNAAEDAWTKAEAVRARQNAQGSPDPLSSALWRDAETTTSPNLSAVTAGQVRGFTADRFALASRDASDNAAQAAFEARGRNMSDAAGAWLGRQQIGQFKQANPGVPVTGAASLAAMDPQALFEATAGRYGSPVSDAPVMNGFRPGQPSVQGGAPPQGLSGASSAPPSASPLVAMPPSPGPSPTSLPVAPTGSPGAVYGPFPAGAAPGLIQPATGGKALAQILHRQAFGGPAPSQDEMASAIDDISADGLVHPMEADAAHAGQNVSPAFALTIAHRVQAARSAPVSANAAGQASAEVAGLTGQTGGFQNGPAGSPPGASAAPFGMDRNGVPVRNPIAYAGARNAYQQHAAALISAAADPAEKAALSQVATAPRGMDKQAVRDVYAAMRPGADLSRFTPALMRGVD